MPPRPRDTTRTRLLQAGLSIARRSGLRAITVRGLAAQAGANLGSFVHHFGTRDAFVEEMVEGWYAPLLAKLQLAMDDGIPAGLRLRNFCLALVRFIADNRQLITHVLLDAGAGEKPAQRFVRAIPSRHPAMLMRLIAEAQASGDLRADAEPAHVMLFILGALALPVVAFTAVGRTPLLPARFAREMQRHACDPEPVAQRLDWVLAGLKPPPAPRRRRSR